MEELIDSCKKGISLPQFSECFRERTEDWWETFAEMEAELRQMMDEDKDHTRGAELVAQMQETLNLVFDEISFEMGFNGEKYELILTPEGDKVKLFELVYFQKHAPKEVLEHWNILVGRQPPAKVRYWVQTLSRKTLLRLFHQVSHTLSEVPHLSRLRMQR